MSLNPSGQTDDVTEIAGEPSEDSPPSERDSEDAENGLEADNDAVSFPGPTYKIDELEVDDRAE